MLQDFFQEKKTVRLFRKKEKNNFSKEEVAGFLF